MSGNIRPSICSLKTETGILCEIEMLKKEDGKCVVLFTHGGSGVLLTLPEAKAIAKQLLDQVKQSNLEPCE